MCGFITITKRTRSCYSDDEISSAVKQAWEDLAVRGQDAFGAARISENTFASHSLLSISDPERTQPQPKFSKHSLSAMVYNGEIFSVNDTRWTPSVEHRCDTSFLLEYIDRYGPSSLDKVDGMFSLTFLQPQSQSLITARDRYGEKPLFWYQDSKLFITSSSPFAIARAIHTLTDSIPTFSARNIIEYLLFGGCSGVRSIFSNIFSHPSGAYGRLDLESWAYSFGRFWRIPQALEDTKSIKLISPGEYLEELKKVLSKKIGDIVPSYSHAMLLSGGVDSAIVAHLHPSPTTVTAYTARFKGEKFLSEDNRAAKTAKIANIKLKFVDIDDQLLNDSLDKIIQNQSYAIDDTSCLMVNLMTQIIGKSYRVCLTGDGADELYFGYSSYTHPLNSLADYANLRFQTLSLARLIVSMVNSNKTGETIEVLQQIIDENTLGSCNLDTLAPFVERARQYDVHFYMKQIVLAKVDMASMLNNVECRTPFMRVPLSESALSLPYEIAQQVSGHNVLKPYLRALLNSIDPSYSIDTPKQGFGAQPELSESLSRTIIKKLQHECAPSSHFSVILRDFFELKDLSLLLAHAQRNIYFGYRMLTLSSYVNRVSNLIMKRIL